MVGRPVPVGGLGHSYRDGDRQCEHQRRAHQNEIVRQLMDDERVHTLVEPVGIAQVTAGQAAQEGEVLLDHGLPAAILLLILCTRVFVTHDWVRYLISHSGLVAIFEGVGFLILGYGTLHNVSSLTSFGFWIIMPCTIELFLVTVVFVVDLAYAAFCPPPGESVSPQKAEIRWAMFFSGVSVLTWVVLGLAAAASEIGISWSFWAGWQHEPTSTLVGNIITSHSHGMLPSFMAVIVFLAAEAFGYSALVGIRKQLARVGAGIMLAGIALYSGVYR